MRVAFVYLLLLVCKPASVDYHRVELPGFSVEVPTTLVYRGDLRADYPTGAVKDKQRTPPFVVGVSWSTGALSTLDELDGYGKLMAQGIGARGEVRVVSREAATVGDAAAVRLEVAIKSMPMLFVEIICGKRKIQITGTKPEAERVIESLRCTPIAELEATPGTTELVGFDAPAEAVTGWSRGEAEPGQLAITNGTTVAVFAPTPDATGVTPDAFERLLPGIMEVAGIGWVGKGRERGTGPEGAREVWYGKMKIDGDDLPGAVTMWPCTGRSGGIMAIVVHPTEVARSAALEVVMKARCARPDDPPLALPTTPAEDP